MTYVVAIRDANSAITGAVVFRSPFIIVAIKTYPKLVFVKIKHKDCIEQALQTSEKFRGCPIM